MYFIILVKDPVPDLTRRGSGSVPTEEAQWEVWNLLSFQRVPSEETGGSDLLHKVKEGRVVGEVEVPL